MKAMLYADWWNLKQSARAVLSMLVIFLLGMLLSGNPAFAGMILVMYSVMLSATLFSVDKAYGWDKMSLSLPVLRKDVVSSKFVVGALTNLSLLTLNSIMLLLYCTVIKRSEPLGEPLAELFLCEAVAVVLSGFMMTSAFKWGVEKSRYILVGMVWIPLLVIFALSHIGFPKPDFQWLETVVSSHPVPAVAGLVILGWVIYGLCYLISVRVYQKTEL